MKRKSDDEISSLDLLLDTICNAFGGVVFIALLMAVLTRTTTESLKADPTQSKAKIEQSRKLHKVEELSASIRALKARVEESTASDVGEKAKEDVNLATIIQANELLRTEVKASEVVFSNTTVQLQSTSAKRDDLSQQIAELRREAEGVVLPASLDLKPDVVRRLPKVQKVNASMNHVWMAVYDGRLYAIDNISYGAESFHASVKAHEEPGPSWVYEPVIERGQLIVPGCERDSILSDLLRYTDNESCVVRFMVDLNSFGQFNYIKELLAERGCRYMFVVEGPPYNLISGRPDDAM